MKMGLSSLVYISTLNIWAFLTAGLMSPADLDFPAKPGKLWSLGNIKKATDIGIKQLHPMHDKKNINKKNSFAKQT